MKLAHIFFDTSMSNGHTGLWKILTKKAKIKALPQGSSAIFLNRKFSALKLLTSEDTLIHLRRPYNRPIDPLSIKYIPYCVGGKTLDYDKAIEAAIKERAERNSKHKEINPRGD